MKIYFTASIRWRNKYGKYYRRIVDYLRKDEHEVMADHILNHKREEIRGENDKERAEYYRWLVEQIRGADVVMAEISYPSTVNVGHEISLALDMGVPVVAFYIKGEEPLVIKAIPSDKIRVVEYTASNLEKLLKLEIEEARCMVDQRFTMLLPREIVRYLDEVAERGVSRSEYIRELIKKDMKSRS